MSIEISTLENGLRILTINMPHLRTATTAAFVKVGSRYETSDINGITHFLEHMMFKGTDKRSVYNIANDAERVGANMNAFTSKEMTAYYISSLSDHIELSTDIISDILTNSLFPQDELDRERGVVLQEIARSYDNPMHLVHDYYDVAAYPDQNYGRTILGDPELIKNVTREQFNNYINTHYTTGNMIVTCAGNVEHNTFVELVKKYFNKVPVKQSTTPIGASYVGGYHHYNKDFEQANIIFGFESCNIFDSNHLTTDLLCEVFGGGMSSPLFTEVREKRGLVYSVKSIAGAGTDFGDFGIFAGTTPDNIKEFIDVSCDELKKLTSIINEEDVFRAKNSFKTHLVSQLEKPFSLALKTVNDLFTYGVEQNIDDEIAKIDAITVSQLKDMASSILSSKPTLCMIGNIQDKSIEEWYDYISAKFK